MTRPILRVARDEQLAMWAAVRLCYTTMPVCPECARFIHPRLWDTHMAGHHEDRVGRAVEACFPPPMDNLNEED